MRKLTYRNAQIPPPQINDWGNPGNGWTLLNNEHYVRGVDRKELATYTGNTLTEWYIWGNDMVGKMKGSTKYYFFKDHLGSIRAVVDNNFNLVSAVDYDMWGDKMQGRIYNGDSTKFGFTGKEEDEESYYDYFGARYYDARVGRWNSTEPLIDKYPQHTPYNYSKNNPLIVLDPDGKDPKRKYLGSVNDVIQVIENTALQTYAQISLALQNVKGNYVYTKKGGFIDMVHFFMAAYVSAGTKSVDLGILGGALYELKQELLGQYSAYNKEDPMSNKLGAEFGKMGKDNFLGIYLLQFQTFMNTLEPLDPNDPSIAEDRIYIPYDESSPQLGPIEGSIDWYNPDPYFGEFLYTSPKYYHEFSDPRIYLGPNF